jgi:putative ABC transport system substrate-binding protein
LLLFTNSRFVSGLNDKVLQMRRRELLSLLTGAAITCLGPVRAQAIERRRRITVLNWYAKGGEDIVPDFEPRLAELGLFPGRDFVIEYHYAEGDKRRVAKLADELVARHTDIIVAIATPAAHAAKRATATIPIVFMVANPLSTGLVESLSRPGGNLTGFSMVSTELSGKRVDFLRQVVPNLTSIGFLGSTSDPNGPVFAGETEAAGAKLGLKVHRVLVSGPDEFPGAFATMVAARVGALIIQPLFVEHRTILAALAMHHRLPTASDQRAFAEAGIMVAYGASREEIQRRLVHCVAEIVRGAMPADFPVEQPTEFEVIVNLKTVKALGLTVPPGLLVGATEVIE